jgi:hypothetical protein
MNNIFTIKNIFATLLSIAIGIVFIFSAYAKIPSLEQFGWTIVETTFLNWTLAEWTARLLIGLEFLLGLFFVFHFSIKKFTIPVATILLLFFTAYLFYIKSHYGNDGNCGCFGDMLKMTPLQGILKNIGLLVAFVILYIISYNYTFKFKNIVASVLSGIVIAIPFIISPPESIYIKDKAKLLKDPIPLSLLYNSTENIAPKIELRKGKHVIAFMSLSCEFCRKAAKRMRIMKAENPNIPFHIILNGDSTNLKEFFDDTKATNIDYSMFNGAKEFTDMTGTNGLPAIKWIEDTTVVKTSNYITLNEIEIIDWLKK